MTAAQFEIEILNSYKGLVVLNAYAELSFFYNPIGAFPKGIYFVTIKENDGPNDKASALFREDVYRINVGISKTSYEKHFGKKPSRPPKGGIVSTGHDFAKLNQLTPHPIYAWLHWVAILNPDADSIPLIKGLLDESYALVLKKYEQKMKLL